MSRKTYSVEKQNAKEIVSKKNILTLVNIIKKIYLRMSEFLSL